MKRQLLTLLIALLTAAVSQAADNTADESTGKGRFVWGAEIGPAIDLCGDDMSTIDIGAHFGYHNDFIDIVGVGAEIDMMMSNSSRMFPIYAIFRSSFSKKKRLVFADVRVGCAVANAFGQHSQTVLYASPGIGFNLAGGKKFQSYMTLSYVYSGMTFPAMRSDHEVTGVNQMVLKIGVTF